MKSSTRRLTLCAISAAVSVCILCLAAVLPSGKLGMVAIAGFLPGIAVMSYGLGAGIACFVVSGALALLIAPLKSPAIIYCLFFGHWPVVKALIERIKSLSLEWVVKLIWFNLILSVALFLMKTVIMPVLPQWSTLIMYAAGNVAFVLYDRAFSVLLWQISSRIKLK